MNENIDLTKILKNCPQGAILYSTVFGEVIFKDIHHGSHTIAYETKTGRKFDVDNSGKMFSNYEGECILFPSKDQRDWSKFKAPWYKKEKFDPKTLKPFDRVLVRDRDIEHWICNLFSHIINDEYLCIGSCFIYCIPYNDDTKHLVGTTDEAPEYYKYWED